MKQAMIGIFILLFAGAASAATMIHMTQGGVDIRGTTTAGITTNDTNIVTGHWTGSTGEFHALTTAHVNEDAIVRATWKPLDVTGFDNATFNFGLVTEAGYRAEPDIKLTSAGTYITTYDLLAGTEYKFDVIGYSVLGKSMDFDLTLETVPLPAALWLFAPALMGLIGLRRKSNKGLVVA